MTQLPVIAICAAVLHAHAIAAQPAELPAAAIASPPAGGSSYTLFHPKPRELWRPLSADRPDTTESPYTVDPGAVQLEMSFFDYTKNGDAETWVAAPFNLKVGLTESTDIQFIFDPYIYHDADGGASTDGVGDVQIRLKWNIWGNDGGRTALAIMPFVKLPTASDDLGNEELEGGVIVPWATDLAEGLGLGLMAEFDFIYDEEDDDYDLELVTTAALGIDLSDWWGMYVEGVAITSTDADFRALAGFGVTYAIDANVVVDAGMNIELTGDADDVNIFSGITVRF